MLLQGKKPERQKGSFKVENNTAKAVCDIYS